MEINTSFQNGQESKEEDIADESQMVSSTGREEEFYTFKPPLSKHAQNYDNCQSHQVWTTDNKEELSIIVENGSISGTVGDGFASALQKAIIEYIPPVNERRSDVHKSDSKLFNNNQEIFLKSKEVSYEFEDSPLK